VSKIKDLYLRTDLRELRIRTSSIHNTALHDLTVTELTVARFEGTEGFLIRYANGHMKLTDPQLKKFHDYF
jgi:hypothetical protein